MSVENRVILTVACTGAWPQKSDTPYIPLTPQEQADEIVRCCEAGASIAHIHVRDEESQASMDFDQFAETVRLVRARCDIVINLTTSGGLGLSDEIRMKPFQLLRPEMGSFDAGTMNWAHSTIFENSPRFLEKLAVSMNECQVKPEFEIFDAGMIYNVLYYMKKGLIEGNPHFQFVLGAPGGMTAEVRNLMFLLDTCKQHLGDNFTWSALGIGRGHLPIVLAALALGGNVRVGMEDNILYRKGELAQSNTWFVERVKRLAAEVDKTIATPDETRAMLGLIRQQPVSA
ncbi:MULTISPECIES: 3-keto-5-aminohexanoate cleavage protein [Klebsiella]|uniref:3-keto-5-aminohexanoate cleavage protein n=1 Tax=Klebsiella TaxID=570 RepID=UPI00116AB41E|nr:MULTISPECIES: 3-keto-5-aminohexanoate cleavage protein [Klebsiella]HEM8051123.1 3-keto-5-aminohexanoate cleavage protein [Enterobacter hormaechei]MCW9635144.1 3-keto-5-aminohexanoate cleavage protein [Klebsiella oxytoca]MDS7802591.1 3-keto-5-aminohexanoate cleavage protein [Klebsiella michiganensis]VUT08281.1 3-keto-5-aminohexanoate cleavage enzyme [Klebsiella pasteurii]HBM2908243.1 3-keto-5-aminohexanoate cleavage protein [Klebsiella michiganensis]